MRTILFTGKGGVGKTTAAAGTAALCAAAGKRTLVMSTDAAHSLADALGADAGVEPSSEPKAIADRLFAQQVDAQQRFEESWSQIQGYLRAVLDTAGVDPIAAEELAVLPMVEEVLALLELRAQARSGQWDVVILDCAPTAETLRLLALPEALGWYLDRVLPLRGALLRAVGPMVKRATGMPLPQDELFEAVATLQAELAEVRSILTGQQATVRLVLTPETMVVAEARRALTTLSLFGYRVDGVIANRVFPRKGEDPWRQRWVAAQEEVLAEVDDSFCGLPVWRGEYLATEPVGIEVLADLAESLYAGQDPADNLAGWDPLRIEATDSGARLTLALPFVAKSDVDLARHGTDLVVTVGSYRRLLALPAALAELDVTAARIEKGRLSVTFEPGAGHG